MTCCQKTRSALEQGAALIQQMRSSGSDLTQIVVQSWLLLEEAVNGAEFDAAELGLDDAAPAGALNLTPQETAVLSGFQQAFTAVFKHLRRLLPESLLFDGTVDEEWVAEFARPRPVPGDLDKRGLVVLYAIAFRQYGESTASRQKNTPVEVGAQHDTNVQALEAHPVRPEKYTRALQNYKAGTPMYQKIVGAVQQLSQKYAMDGPEFKAAYNLFGKIKGVEEDDEKVLKRMGVAKNISAAAPAQTETWRETPFPWSKAGPGLGSDRRKKIDCPQLAHVRSDSSEFKHSLLGAHLCRLLFRREQAQEADDAQPAALFQHRSEQSESEPAPIGAEAASSGETSFFLQQFLVDQLGRDAQARFAYVRGFTDFAEWLAGMGFLFTRISQHTFEVMHAYNIHVPVDILLVRPFIAFEMFHAVLCRAGRETGRTAVGHLGFYAWR